MADMNCYGIAQSYEPTGLRGHCEILACAYPGRGLVVYDHWRGTVDRKIRCWWHLMTDSSPLSMEYEDADCLVGIPRHKTGSYDGKISGHHFSKDHPWISAAIMAARLRGRSTREAIKSCGVILSRHLKDTAYNVFPELAKGRMYGACGEKVYARDCVAAGEEPNCESCLRIYRSRIAELPKIPLRQAIVTLPKEKPERLSFEDLVAAGIMEVDESAFSARRNWGRTIRRSWNDSTRGVQRDSRLRWDRGGVNRKRG